MEFNLRGFWDVLTWQVNWLDANFFWVIASLFIYGFILFMVSFHLYLEIDASRRKSDERKEEERIKVNQDLKKLFAYLLLPLFVLYLFVETLAWLGIIHW